MLTLSFILQEFCCLVITITCVAFSISQLNSTTKKIKQYSNIEKQLIYCAQDLADQKNLSESISALTHKFPDRTVEIYTHAQEFKHSLYFRYKTNPNISAYESSCHHPMIGSIGIRKESSNKKFANWVIHYGG